MSEIKSQEEIEPNDDLHPVAASNDRLAQVFESSARRWELIVYPSLFAFIILAAYGFYLIFNLPRMFITWRQC